MTPRPLGLCLGLLLALPVFGQLQSGPPLPYHPVKDWAQLPAGWVLGQCSGVTVDPQDNVWLFNRSERPVIEFNREGHVLQVWTGLPIKSAHGIKLDADGNVWLVDVAGHAIFKCDPHGRVLLRLGLPGQKAGDNDSREGFNRPTNLFFLPNGDFLASDGYINSRVIRFDHNGRYLYQWGRKGTGDGEFNLVHDVCVDPTGRVYVADRDNRRVQIFDLQGKFLGKWTDAGSAWGFCYRDDEKAIYMCDGTNSRVVKLNLSGKVLGVLGSKGSAPGQFLTLHNLAMDSEKSLYTVEITGKRIQKFARE